MQLHTHLYVREEVLSLYGFAEAGELALFELLLTVSGVGPRLALAILSTAPPERLAQEIANGEDTLLLRVPRRGAPDGRPAHSGAERTRWTRYHCR